jgi:hypothetical protein
MNTSKLKRFAPACRTALIEQVEVKLDYVLTAQTPDLSEKADLLQDLRSALKTEGREALVERVAYIWFNRFAAFRHLDAHNWHPFKARLITSANADDVLPELLQQVRKGMLPEELKPFVSLERINQLLDGQLASANPQAEVQRLLVIGVSQYYAALQPGLFNKIDAFTELLLPDDLITEHSVVHGFATEISDADCAEVEVLGWLYQFYISEKKDAVMARKKAVPSEDIPAVTQLFTPHWIVRYLVENSLGRLWLRSRPHSRLKEHMPYYIEDPEGQTPADSLTVATPEEIKLLDPACGSGHMLTYAFDLLVKIYEEEGHAPSEIPEKILTHNLFGLEICPRAAQLAQFALVCKAREQSRAAFRRPVQPRVMCLRDVVLSPDEMQAWSAATGVKLSQDELAQIHQFRENTETFGSLIQPVLNGGKLAALVAKIGEQAPAGDLLVQNTHRKLRLVLDQAEMLSQRYQVVVANPPYMGSGSHSQSLASWMKTEYPNSKADLFSAFIERCLGFCVASGLTGLIVLPSWLFLATFRKLRESVIREALIESLLHMGRGIFGIDWGSTAFVLTKSTPERGRGVYFRLHKRNFQHLYFGDIEKIFLNALRSPSYRFNFDTYRDKGTGNVRQVGSESASDGLLIRYAAAQSNFTKIPSSPIAYWISNFSVFDYPKLGDNYVSGGRIKTHDGARFIRFVWETSSQSAKWKRLLKGGDFRKHSGNEEYLVDWGETAVEFYDKNGGLSPGKFHNREGICWSKITSTFTGFRIKRSNSEYDSASPTIFCEGFKCDGSVLSFLNSCVARYFLMAMNPTLNTQVADVLSLPVAPVDQIRVSTNALESEAISISATDWDNFETSSDFSDLPLLRLDDWEVEPGQPGGSWKGRTLAESWDYYATYCTAAIGRMQELETETNRLWIDAYGLQDELTAEVPEEEITLARADPRKDMSAFLSYAVGCMMGRYSLDQPGLILADAGDTIEQYFEKVGKSADEVTFLPDDDAIIPITEDEWFEDDAAARVREFIKVTFGKEALDENITFIEESLGKNLRKYFTANAVGFYADHVKAYKKRPIYWMFESPKKHFRALVYLHRYTKDTVNTLLNGYLREFRHKLAHRRDELQGLVATDTATVVDRRALKTTLEAIKDVETYERDILLPLAQQRLNIDLDDGVKVNYPRLGKALAKVTGLS